MPNADPIVLGYFTADAVSAYRLARAEAFRMGHPEIESDHLLLGLVAERHGRAAEVLASFGLTYAGLADLRTQVRERRPRRGSMNGVILDTVSASRDVKQVLEIAKILAQIMNPGISDIVRANTAHVLYALAISNSASPRVRMLLADSLRPAQEVLLVLGINPETLRLRVLPGLNI